MKLAGNVVLFKARAMVTVPSSKGWRRTSSVRRLNSGSSSRNNTPLWAIVISPGVGVGSEKGISPILVWRSLHPRDHVRISTWMAVHCRS